jgi:hypothetical protein
MPAFPPPSAPIPGFPDYKIFRDGTIWSWRKNSAETRTLVPRIDRYGYHAVGLYRDGKRFYMRVHRLVWEAHVGPIPDGMTIDHLNEVKADNRLENLEVVSTGENLRRARENGRRERGSIPDETIIAAIEDHNAGMSAYRAADKHGISTCHFAQIVRGVKRKDLHYLFTR